MRSASLLCLLFICRLNAQFSGTDSLQLGKRGNVIWDRKISVFNMGNEKFNSYYRIYYRTPSMDRWRGTGLLGGRIRKIFAGNPEAMKEFRRYRKKKLGSYFLFAGGTVSFTGWMGYSVYDMVNRTQSIRSYFSPISLGFLAMYFTGMIYGQRMNIKGDLHLMRAAMIINGRAAPSPSAIPIPIQESR